MKTGYFNAFRSYINGPGKSLAITGLFYAFWLVINRVTSADFDLKSFHERTIGIATLNGIDVGARISIFYSCILVFFGFISGFVFIGYIFFKKLDPIRIRQQLKYITIKQNKNNPY